MRDEVTCADRWATFREMLSLFVSDDDVRPLPDDIASHLRAGVRPLQWSPLPETPEMGDGDLWVELIRELKLSPDASVAIVFDECFADGVGPICCDGEQVLERVAAFMEERSPGVRHVDVLLVSTRKLMLVQHESIWGHTVLPES